jgi:lysophospholipase L1-like esterase
MGLTPNSAGFPTRLARRQLLTQAAVFLSAGALTSHNLAALAQDGSPEAVPEVDFAAIRGTVQYIHPEKIYFYLPGFQREDFVAGTYGLDVETYRAIRAEFAAAARGAAAELLADDAFAGLVDRLPFQPDELVVAIGESDTDDLQSWFEILRYLIDIRRPEDGIRLLNLAISGQTTADVVGQLLQALAWEPDWILAGVGGNDAGRTGIGATKTDVSPEETERNLTNLRSVAAAQSEASWVWLTRWSVDEDRIAAYPGFAMGQFSGRAEDLDAVSELVRQQPDPVVDISSIFGRPAALEFLVEDGLHPSLAGQQLIARTVVERLADLPGGRGGA